MRRSAITFIFVLIAIVACAQNKASDSLNKLNDSIRQAVKFAKDDTSKVNALLRLGDNYVYSAPDSSLMYGREALKLSQKINFVYGVAYAEQDMSRAFTTLGNYQQALDYGLKSLDFFKKMNSPSDLVYALADIGMCYREEGDYKKSLDYFHQAFKAAKPSMLTRRQTYGLGGMISSVYAKNRQPDSALFYAQKTYKYFKTWSGITYVLGSAYAQKGEYKLAMDFYRKTIVLAPGGSEIDILDACNGMSSLFLQKGQTDSAIYYAKLALTQKWGKTYPVGVFHATDLLSNLYESKHMPDSALKYLRLTISMKDSLYSSQKQREVQNIAFNNQLQQQALDQQRNKAQTRLILISLAGGMFTLLVIGFMQWRSNRHKQKTNKLLNEQKEEIAAQRDNLEDTLDELKTTQNQLVQREKMASLGELTAGIAHEIQNPLNFVNNFSEINTELIEEMQEEIGKGNYAEVKSIADDLKVNQQKINQHGKRADFIVKGMLEHSRTSTGERTATNINVLADEFLKLSYHGLRAKDKSFNVEMVTHFDTALPKINIVQQDIGRVLLNLYNNAFYAVNQKARTAGDGYKPAVEVSTAQQNGSVIISVKDNGDGIPEAIKDKIMQPFFTTKPTGEGTGLGLSLSYDIVVKGHGGKIDVNTKENEFTEFIVILPLN